MISNKYFSTLVLTLISFSAYAQFSLKVKDVNLVAYGDYKVELVCVKNNKFYEIGFDSDENDSISSITVSEDYYENSKENILKNRKEIKVEDITRIKINSFIQTKKYEVINKDQKQVFSLLNNQIAMLEYYQFENYYDNQKHKNVKDWNLTYTDFKSIYLLDIGLGKNIVVIGNNDGYIIPTSKKPIIQYQEYNEFYHQ